MSPEWETGRTTAGGCLLVSVGSNSGGNVFFPAEIAVGTRTTSKTTTAPTAANTTLLQARRKLNDKKTLSEENKQFDPRRERREATALQRGCNDIAFLGGGERWVMGCWLLVLRVLCLCVPVCLFCLLFYQVIISQRAEMWEETRRKPIKSPEGKHLHAYQPLEDGEDQRYPVRLYRNALG